MDVEKRFHRLYYSTPSFTIEKPLSCLYTDNDGHSQKSMKNFSSSCFVLQNSDSDKSSCSLSKRFHVVYKLVFK